MRTRLDHDKPALSGSAMQEGLHPGLRDARLLPGPATAPELAASEAGLHTPVRKSALTRTRVLAGTAAIAIAVTIPDLSAGAMDAPVMRIDVGEPELALTQPIWTPAAASAGPVHASAMAAERIAPSALTATGERSYDRSANPLALGFLEHGSERFDLAFAGVAMPTPASISVSAGLPDQPPGEFRASMNALRARLIDVEQIGMASPLAREAASSPRIGNLDAGNAANPPVAVSSKALEAAFAGQLDVSGEVRRALPMADAAPAATGPARIAAITRPEASLSARLPASLPASLAEHVELVPKTKLDARVNGVLTGSLDFQQQGGTIALRLGSVVDMLAERYDAEELAQLRSSGAMDSYVPLARLQAAGIPVSYSPAYDEIEFGIDYDDAPQAAKVQVEQIGAPTSTGESAMIDQIPR